VEDLALVGLLAEIEDSVLPISTDRHADIIATRAKVCHMKTIPEASLDPPYLCNAWSNNQKVIDVYCDIHVAQNKDIEIGVDGLKAKISKETGQRLIPDTRCLLQAVECLAKLASPQCAVCGVMRLFNMDLMVYLAV
jgi:hypothetical protein